MPETNESPVVHTHARCGDTSTIVLDHVGKLQYLTDKVKEHSEQLRDNETMIKTMTESLTSINSNISAVKWVAVGCGVMFIINQFGLINALKIWLKI